MDWTELVSLRAELWRCGSPVSSIFKSKHNAIFNVKRAEVQSWPEIAKIAENTKAVCLFDFHFCQTAWSLTSSNCLNFQTTTLKALFFQTKSKLFPFSVPGIGMWVALWFYGAFYSQNIVWKMPFCRSAISLLPGNTILVLKGFDCHLQ